MKTRCAGVSIACVLSFVACGGKEASEPGGESGAGGGAGIAGANAAGRSAAGSAGSGSGGSSSGSAGSSAGDTSQAGGSGSAGASAGGGGKGGDAGGGGLAGNGGAASGAAGNGASGSAAGGASGAGNGGSSGGGELTGEPMEMMLQDLPAVRQEHSVAAAAGEVYVIGGYTPQISASVLAYNPETDLWRERADFPAPMNHGNAASVADKIYVAGFYVGGMSTASGQTFVYDPAADEWSELTPMPTATERAAACAAALGTKIYVFGGANDDTVGALASVYDTANDSWETLPPLPETREHCVAGAISGKLYIGGGRTHSIPEFRPNTYEFDPDAKTYTQKETIPTPRGGVAGGVLGNRLFVVGGEGNTGTDARVFENVEAYDPATNTWEEFAPLIEPRHGLGGAVLNGKLYLPGGAERQGGDQYEGVSVYYFE